MRTPGKPTSTEGITQTARELESLVETLPALRRERDWTPWRDLQIRCLVAARWCTRWAATVPLAEEQEVLRRLHGFFTRAAQQVSAESVTAVRQAAVRALIRVPEVLYREYPQVRSGLIPSRLEWHPRSLVLLVSKQPGPVELRTGVSFCDSHTLVYRTRCGHCAHFTECYRHPYRPDCLGYHSVESHTVSESWLRQGQGLRNAGDALAPMLQQAGLWRPIWGAPEDENLVGCALTNVFRLPPPEPAESESPAPSGLHPVDSAPLWLLALEALLVAPVVTVALGYDAALAIQRVADQNRFHFATTTIALCPPFGYVIPAYQPVEMIREQREVQQALVATSIQNALRKAANIARQSFQHPYATTRDLFSISEYQKAPGTASQQDGDILS